MIFQQKTKIKLISFLYAILVTISFLMPLDSYFIKEITETDTLPGNNTSYAIHLIIFFIFYFLFYLAYNGGFKVLTLVIIYSIVIEISQVFTSRGFQISDIIFNIIGVLFSFAFISYFFKKR